MSAIYDELERIIHRLPPAGLELLLKYARQLEDEDLTPDEIADIEAGKSGIARGEWVDWDDLKKELDL